VRSVAGDACMLLKMRTEKLGTMMRKAGLPIWGQKTVAAFIFGWWHRQGQLRPA
jgi:hypothetical protein